MNVRLYLPAAIALVAIFVGSRELPAQAVPAGAHATGLRILVDRREIKVSEAIFLAVRAETFPEGPVPSITVLHGKDRPVEIVGRWLKSLYKQGDKIVQQLTTLLLFDLSNAEARFVFYEPGDYTVVVKVGDDITRVAVKVSAGEADDAKAYASVGIELLPTLFWEDANADPSQKLLDAADKVVRQFPKSRCAEYCRAYMSIARFKKTYNDYQKRGGALVYAPLAEDLEKCLEPFTDSYFAEEVGFYAAYSYGLCQQFPKVLGVLNSIKTRLTIYAPSLLTMQGEVEQHVPNLKAGGAPVPRP